MMDAWMDLSNVRTYLSSSLHGVPYQKTILFMVIASRTSYFNSVIILATGISVTY